MGKIKTKPFPWHRYTGSLKGYKSLREGLTALALHTELMLRNPDTRAEVEMYVKRAPGNDDIETSMRGGWLEFVEMMFVLEKGVVVHIDDEDLLQKAHRSSVQDTVTLNDLKPPFPAMEIRFADSTPPVIFLDLACPQFIDYLDKVNRVKTRYMSIENKQVAISVPNPDENSPTFIHGKFVNRDEPLMPQLMSTEKTMSDESGLKLLQRAYTAAAMSMLMRREETGISGKRDTLHGVPSNIASSAKKRRQYRVVRPLYMSRDKAYGKTSADGVARGKVSAHWRMAHLRILAHERFHRDEDGRVRIVEIPATGIHGGGKKEVKV